MRVTYWADFACPFCYIAKTRLAKAIEKAGIDDVRIEMRSLELYPHAPKTPTGTTLERAAAKYGISETEAARRIESVSQMGRDEGIDLRYATTRNSNTFDAHRLAKLARDKGNGLLEDLLYKAYFADNLVLADHEVLKRTAAEAGLGEADVDRVLASDAYAAEVRADEQEASDRGVHAVPYFTIDDTYSIAGCCPTDAFEQALRKAASQEAAPSRG